MSRTSWNKDEGGQAVIVVALTFLALLMAVGLAIDAGQLYVARRTMQEAADAAAYAGAVVKYQGGTTLQAKAAAVSDATKNGYTDCGLPISIACPFGQFHVDVQGPPSSGTFANNTSYVEVRIWGAVKTALVPGQSALTQVGVRGVAGAGPLNNGYAIMALDRGSTQRSFYADNQADIHLTGGGILVNSSNSQGAWSDQCSAARFTIDPPHGTYVVGQGYNCFPSTGDGLQPNYPAQADPLAGQPKPEPAGLVTHNALPAACNSTCTIDPGIWTVEIGGAGTSVIYLNPGIYILQRGINASGNADLRSNPGGVFLFNTHTHYCDPVATGDLTCKTFRAGIDSCSMLNLAGNAVTTVNAMTSAYVSTLDPTGRYLGNDDPQEWQYVNFLVYQDPVCTNPMQIAGNGLFAGSGTIYVPNAEFVFSGQNATLTGSQLIAKTVNIQSGNITINFDAGNTVQPVLPRLSE